MPLKEEIEKKILLGGRNVASYAPGEKVVGLAPIPSRVLDRPRIYVIAQTSGLFRDSYAQVIRLIDRAVRMAGAYSHALQELIPNFRCVQK